MKEKIIKLIKENKKLIITWFVILYLAFAIFINLLNILGTLKGV